ALFCIVANAVESVAASGGGLVRVAVGSDGARSLIEVEDEGAGFAPGARERILEPFFTTKPGHLGLGCKIAQRILTYAGGALELAERKPRGVRAVLKLVRS